MSIELCYQDQDEWGREGGREFQLVDLVECDPVGTPTPNPVNLLTGFQELEQMVQQLDQEVMGWGAGKTMTTNTSTTRGPLLPLSTSPSETPSQWWEKGMRCVMEFQGEERWHQITDLVQIMITEYGVRHFFRWENEHQAITREAARRQVRSFLETKGTRHPQLLRELLALKQSLVEIGRQLHRVELQVQRVSPTVAEALLQVRSAIHFLLDLEVEQRMRSYRSWRQATRQVAETTRASWEYLHRLFGRRLIQQMEEIMLEFRTLDSRLQSSLGPRLEHATCALERCRQKWRIWLDQEQRSLSRFHLQQLDPAATDALHVLLHTQDTGTSSNLRDEMTKAHAMETHLMHIRDLLAQSGPSFLPPPPSRIAKEKEEEEVQKPSAPELKSETEKKFDDLWQESIVYEDEDAIASSSSRVRDLLLVNQHDESSKDGDQKSEIKKADQCKKKNAPPPLKTTLFSEEGKRISLDFLDQWLKEVRELQEELQGQDNQTGQLSSIGEEARRILQEETCEELCQLTCQVTDQRARYHEGLIHLWQQKQLTLDRQHRCVEDKIDQQVEVARGTLNQFERYLTHTPAGLGGSSVNLTQLVHRFRHTFQLLIDKRQQFLFEEDLHLSSQQLRDLICPVS